MRWMTLFLAVVLCAACLMAQDPAFVFTNNDRSPNSVSAFSVAANGSLTVVPGSPFLTGGTGIGGGFFASNRFTTAIVTFFTQVMLAATMSAASRSTRLLAS